MAAMCSELIGGGQCGHLLCSDAVVGAGEVDRYYRPGAAVRIGFSMPRITTTIARDIARFAPDEDGDWRRLDVLLDELWQAGAPEQAILEMLSVFERYPEDDGHGVMWSLVHGLEKLPNYESALLSSLARQPSELGIVMVGRMLNSGVTAVDGVSLLFTLQEIAGAATSAHIKETARSVASRPR